MPNQKISSDPEIVDPTQRARLAGIDHGKSTTTNYQFGPAAVKSWLQTGAADLSATGTRDATSYLRGDNVWAAPSGGGGTPNFSGYIDPHAAPYNAYGNALETKGAETYADNSIRIPGYTWSDDDIGKLLWTDATTWNAVAATITSVDTTANRGIYSGTSMGAGTNRWALLGHDDTAALQAALNDAAITEWGAEVGAALSHTASERRLTFGRAVRLRSGGKYMVRLANLDTQSSALIIRRRTGLVGAGSHLSEIILAPQSYGSVIANEGADSASTQGYADFIHLSGFSINGNKFACPNAVHGVRLILAFDGYSYVDAFTTVFDVFAYEIKQSGFRIAGRGEGLYSHLRAMQCSYHGFELSSVDNTYIACNSGGSGLAGFKVDKSANCRFVGCKSYYSGASADGATAPWNTANWWVTADQFRNGLSYFIGCEAQEARGSCWYIESGLNTFVGCLAGDPGRVGLSNGSTVVRAGYHLANDKARMNSFEGCRTGPSVGIFDATNWGGTNGVHVSSGAHLNQGTIYTMTASDGHAGTAYPGGSGAVGGAAWTVDRNPGLFVDGVSPRGTLAASQDRIKSTPIAAAETLALGIAHIGHSLILSGAGATVSMDGTTLGDGFAVKVVNNSGADWTVPTPTNGTLRWDTTGHTKISAGGSGAIETFTDGGIRYFHVTGTTV